MTIIGDYKPICFTYYDPKTSIFKSDRHDRERVSVYKCSNCEKCGHIVHIFKDYDLQTDQEIILTECSNCKSKHIARREYGFWWFYFSDLDFKRMYKNILDEE